MKDTKDFNMFSVAVAPNAKDNDVSPLTSAAGNMQHIKTLRQIDGWLRSQSRRPGIQCVEGRGKRFLIHVHLREAELLRCPSEYRAIIDFSRRRQAHGP
jgi:hypothetical protein